MSRYRAASDDARASGTWAQDRPSNPHRQPQRVSSAVHDRVCAARERTGWGPRLIAGELGMAHATVSRCLVRRGMSRRPPRERDAVRRFERPCPGNLLQMDVKRFASFTRPGHAVTGDRFRTSGEKRMRVGWEFCHSITDDHSRLVFQLPPGAMIRSQVEQAAAAAGSAPRIVFELGDVERMRALVASGRVLTDADLVHRTLLTRRRARYPSPAARAILGAAAGPA